MGTEQDRARVRSRLVAASEPPLERGSGSAFEPTVETGGRGSGDSGIGDSDIGDPGIGDTGVGDAGIGGADHTVWGPDWLSADADHAAFRSEASEHRRGLWARWRGARVGLGVRGGLALVLVGVVAAGIAAVSVWRDRPVPQTVPPLPVVEVREPDETGDAVAGSAAKPDEPPAVVDEHLVVSVVGLVHQAGLVRLPPGSRVADALAAAGGVRSGADVLGLNMAERVADGDQILVGVAAPDGVEVTVGSARVGSGSAASGSGAGTLSKGVGKVDLNSAGVEELDRLPGVGPVTAAAILAWRQSNGRFTAVEQLGEVDGIGPARLAKLRDLVTL